MTTCVLCAKRQTERGYTCQPCLDRLAQHLHDVQAEAEMLSAVPSMAQPTGSRGGTLASHRSPARLDVLALTDPRTRPDWDDTTLSVLGVLGGWARVVREERALTWPERITVTSERKTLSTQLDWIAAQPWVDELARDLRALRGQLKACNGTQDPRPEGSCYLLTDGTTCGGPIWLDTANGHAHCGRCRATWDGPQLAHLKWELDRAKELRDRPHTDDGRPFLTVQELADGAGVSVNAAYIRLSRAGIRATGSHYHPDALAPAEMTA
jgi:hypothetical protein